MRHKLGDDSYCAARVQRFVQPEVAKHFKLFKSFQVFNCLAFQVFQQKIRRIWRENERGFFAAHGNFFHSECVISEIICRVKVKVSAFRNAENSAFFRVFYDFCRDFTCFVKKTALWHVQKQVGHFVFKSRAGIRQQIISEISRELP